MSVASANKRSSLTFRSDLVRKTRAFFEARGVLEVDCPALEAHATIDLHIDPVLADSGFLHTSPEYGMKKLLAKGSGDIYQLSHVYRREEKSPLHTVEFSMLEWYRTNLSFEELIEETCALIQTVIPGSTFEYLTFSEAFERCVGPLDIPTEVLWEKLPNISFELRADRAALIDLCFAEFVEPNLPNGAVITEFPAQSAALAKVETNAAGELVARRFEVYLQGVEIANGYDELQEASELQKRFEETNRKRQENGKAAFEIDHALLAAIEAMPPCVGVALGFDRLVMLAAKAKSVSEIQCR